MAIKKIVSALLITAVALTATACSEGGLKPYSDNPDDADNPILNEDEKETDFMEEVATEDKGELPKLLYADDEIKIFEVKPLETPDMADFEWIDILAEPIFERCDAIIKGVLSNEREVELSYWYDDHEALNYDTLYDFTISEVLYQKDGDLKSGEIIVVDSFFSSRLYPSYEMIPTTGKEIVLFCIKFTSEKEPVLKLDKVSDYGAFLHPALVMKNNLKGYDTENILKLLTAPINASLADEIYKDKFASMNEDNALFEAYLTEKGEDYRNKTEVQ